MKSFPIIVLRYSGKYGHFRRPYTNVSALSYPFPPRTAIAGLLGAIMGVPKTEVAGMFNPDKLKVAVSIESDLKTITHVANLRQAGHDISYLIKKPKKDWSAKLPKRIGVPPFNEVTRIPMEIMRNPTYMLYISLANNSHHSELVSRIINERCVYTPCLGLSEFFAQINYVGEGIAERIPPNEYDISTVVHKDECNLLLDRLVLENHHIQELKAPYLGTPDREFIYRTYLLNMAPQEPLPVLMKTSPYKFNDKIITFL